LHHVGVMRLPMALALCNFLPQIRQANVCPVALNQILFSILAGTSAFGAHQADNLAG
jgi:hypothetical protein